MENAEDLELQRLRQKRMESMIRAKEPEPPKPSLPEGVLHLSEADFDSFLSEHSEVPILMDYWAEWCRPCMMVAPTIEALEKKYRGQMLFAKVNIDHNPRIAQRFQVASIPTFHIFWRGRVFDHFVGALPAAQFEGKVVQTLKKVKDKKRTQVQ